MAESNPKKSKGNPHTWYKAMYQFLSEDSYLKARNVVAATFLIMILIQAFISMFSSDEDKLLNPPFLAFSAGVVFVLLFYKPIKNLILLKKIKIKWGDKEISFDDLEDKVDAEIAQQIADLSDKLEDIQNQINQGTETSVLVEPHGDQKRGKNKSKGGPQPDIAFYKAAFGIDSQQLAGILFHLDNSLYRWRNAETLSKRTGLGYTEIVNIAQNYPNWIIRSRAKSGNVIYRLSDSAKQVISHAK